MKRAFAILAVAVLVAGIFAVSGSAGDATKGKVIYTRSCLKCHAADGSGQPAIAKALKVEMKALGSEEVQKLTDEQIKKDIVEGTGKMQKVAGLSDQDVADVIAYVRTFAKKAAK
ncbi:MAG: c-type cytochrome [Candidatus Acidiferrales bacterium]